MKNKIIQFITLGAMVTSVNAATVLLGGFDGTNVVDGTSTAGSAKQDASIIGNATVTMTNSENFRVRGTDPSTLWGTTNYDPDAATTGNVHADNSYTLTFVVTNTGANDLRLDTFHFRASRDNNSGGNAPADLTADLTYTGGDLLDTDGASDLIDLVDEVNNISGYDYALSSLLTDRTLSTGEAATFTFALDGETWLRTSNFAFGGEVVAIPEPSATALLGLGGLALILRRRK